MALKCKILLLCLVIEGCWLSSSSYSQHASEDESRMREVGRFSGVVLDSQSEEPIPYAVVSLLELRRKAFTDKDGRFTFSDLPFGRYTLATSKARYLPESLPIDFTPRMVQPVEIVLKVRIYRLEPIVVTASRREQRADRVPQNIAVLTREEIEGSAAHNLSEVLNDVPGLTIQLNGGPGNVAYPMIQGGEYRHTLVLIDGLPINTETEGLADISQIPLENIERIEVQKGSGSSAWGSSLGGVVNVITASQSPSEGPSGDVGVSFGERDTRGYHLKASGSIADIGCLLALRQLKTEGFRPKNDYEEEHLFAKVETYITESSKLTASFGTHSGEGAGDQFIDLGYRTDQKRKNGYALLHWTAVPTRWISVEASLQGIEQDLQNLIFQIPSDDLLSSVHLDERTLGTNLQTVILLGNSKNLTAGLDVFWSELDSEHLGGKRDTSRKAIYLTGEVGAGALTFLLGGRFDKASAYGSQFSPHLGMVWRLPGWKTMLRSVIFRGFGAPPLSFKYYEDPVRGRLANPDIRPERVWSYHTGLESTYFPWFRVKLGLFRADVSDAIETVVDTLRRTARKENIGKERRQGGEAELAVRLPLGFSLSAAGSFNDVRDLRTDQVIKGRPRVTYDLRLDYKHPIGFRGSLKGHCIWWNQAAEVKALDRKFVWDLKLSQRLVRTRLGSLRGSLSVHNLFDVRSGWTYAYPLPGRWLEGEVVLALKGQRKSYE